ncbi:MAG: hypothetical protein JXR48_18975 [Candidatus Delongbacteria bacterium]|nr:hypothetical protein [Candidatus Delongbacteria bacterium]MBN2837044.1 hypothetical protein [Candidatus Delongbacteria bacterium]
MALKHIKRYNPDRFEIAIKVIYFSSFWILIMSLEVIIMSYFLTDKTQLMENIKLIFSSVLPLLGSWVGTVLAFYFSRANDMGKMISTEKKNKDDTGFALTKENKILIEEILNFIYDPHLFKNLTLYDLKLFFEKNDTIVIPVLTKKGNPYKYISKKGLYSFLSESIIDDSSFSLLQNLSNISEMNLKHFIKDDFHTCLIRELDDMIFQNEDNKKDLIVFITENGSITGTTTMVYYKIRF